jgi:hypothetical protein
MRSASVFRHPSSGSNSDSRIVNTGLTYIKAVNIGLLLISIGYSSFQDFVDYGGGTFLRELQGIHRLLNSSSDYQLRNQPDFTG